MAEKQYVSFVHSPPFFTAAPKDFRIAAFTGHSQRVTSCALSLNGEYLASGSADNTLRLWDTATGKEIRKFTGHSYWVTSCVFAPSGEYIVSGAMDNTLRLWETATGKEIRKFTGHSSYVSACAFDPSGEYILSASWDNTLRLCETATGECLKVFALLPQGECASWMEKEQRLLAASPQAWRWLGLTPASGFDRYPIEALSERQE